MRFIGLEKMPEGVLDLFRRKYAFKDGVLSFPSDKLGAVSLLIEVQNTGEELSRIARCLQLFRACSGRLFATIVVFNIMTLIRFAYCLIASLLFPIVCQAEGPIRPNILYFYVDDMGWGALRSQWPIRAESQRAASLDYAYFGPVGKRGRHLRPFLWLHGVFSGSFLAANGFPSGAHVCGSK